MTITDIIAYSIGVIAIITGMIFVSIELYKDWKENKRK